MAHLERIESPPGTARRGKAKIRECFTCSARQRGMFCDLSPDSVEILNRNKVTHRFGRGHILFNEGSPAQRVYCLRSGKIKVYKAGRDGKETILKVAKAGDVLGYESIITQQDYHATAEGLEAGEVCISSSEVIVNLLREDPTLILSIVRKMGEDLFEIEERFSDMMNKPVRPRLIELLLRLEKEYGRKEHPGTYLDVRLTRHELGSLVGAASETVIRLLSTLTHEGLLELDGKRIYLKDIEALQESSHADE